MKARADTTKRFPPKNAAGKPQCRECGTERPPKAAWRTWCSEECVEAYKIRAWPAHARKAAIERDRGVCGGCGVDTERLAQWLLSLPSASHRLMMFDGPPIYGRHDRYTYGVMHGALLGRHRGRAMVLLGRLWGVKLDASSHLFEIDHIVPVAEGGGGCGLDNLRTLCRRCHRLESAALNARLRRRPSKGVGRGF